MVYLLSIDGGGVKGLIPAKILALIEENICSDIYSKFNYYAGTSIGAVIVISIAHNRMKCKDIYNLFTQDNYKRLFHKDFKNYLPFTSKYSGESKRDFLISLFNSKTYQLKDKYVYVPAYDLNSGAKIFKSTEENDNIRCYDIANASTAAPTYYPSVKIDSANYIDGGIVANNPAMILLSEALAKVDVEDIKLLSIGCGYKNIKQQSNPLDIDGLQWIKDGLIDDFMGGSIDVANNQCYNILDKDDNYLRINMSLDGALEDLDNTKHLSLSQYASRIVSEDLDNITQENILSIERLATKMFYAYLPAITRFFKD